MTDEPPRPNTDKLNLPPPEDWTATELPPSPAGIDELLASALQQFEANREATTPQGPSGKSPIRVVKIDHHEGTFEDQYGLMHAISGPITRTISGEEFMSEGRWLCLEFSPTTHAHRRPDPEGNWTSLNNPPITQDPLPYDPENLQIVSVNREHSFFVTTEGCSVAISGPITETESGTQFTSVDGYWYTQDKNGQTFCDGRKRPINPQTGQEW